MSISIWKRAKSPELPRFSRSTKRQENAPCHNCATVYSGNFCPECGQESYIGAPTAIDFIYEFLTRNIFERGKMPRTLWHLLRYPGGLTVDFLEGRRQRFIRPVRLYFGLSVLYFLILSLSGNLSGKLTEQLIVNSSKGEPAITINTKGNQVVKNAPMTGTVPDEEAGKTANKQAAPEIKLEFLNKYFGQGTNTRIENRINQFMSQPQEKQLHQALDALFNQAPKAMFFLVPVFAFMLKLMFAFRRIPYGAHLLFAFNYHALLFLILPFMLLPISDFVSGILFFFMSAYLFLAIRTTYNSSIFGTFMRWLALNIFYPIIILITLMLATLAAVFVL